ncbi:FadR/GntR family transcriptional regulator [Mycobacterium colombiense]
MTVDPPALRRADWERRQARGLSRPEQAAEQLASMAMSAQPGQRLGTKDELRAACGVSVGTFNEALRMVQARELVTVRSGPGGGLFASRQSPLVRFGNAMLSLDDDAASLADAFRLRHALDPLLVQDALEHASAHDVATLRGQLDQMKIAAANADSIAFIRANWELHIRLAEISPSPLLRSFYLHLLEVTDSHLLMAEPVHDESLSDYLHSRYDLHVALIDAIAEHNPHALELIREHNATGPRIGEASPASAATSGQ